MIEKQLVIPAADESLPEIEAEILASALQQSEERGDPEGAALARAQLARSEEKARARAEEPEHESDNLDEDKSRREAIATLDESEPDVLPASDNVSGAEVQWNYIGQPQPATEVEGAFNTGRQSPADSLTDQRDVLAESTGEMDNLLTVKATELESACRHQVQHETARFEATAQEGAVPPDAGGLMSAPGEVLDDSLPEKVVIPDCLPRNLIEAKVRGGIEFTESVSRQEAPETWEFCEQEELIVMRNFVAAILEAMEESEPVIEVEAVAMHAVSAMSKKKGDGAGRKHKNKKSKYTEGIRTTPNEAPSGISVAFNSAPQAVTESRGDILQPLTDLPDIPLGDDSPQTDEADHEPADEPDSDKPCQNGDQSVYEISSPESTANSSGEASIPEPPPGNEIYSTIDFGEPPAANQASFEAGQPAADESPTGVTPAESESAPKPTVEQRAEVYSQLDLGDEGEHTSAGDADDSGSWSLPEMPPQENYSQLDLGGEAADGVDVRSANDFAGDAEVSGPDPYALLDFGPESPDEQAKAYAVIDFGLPEDSSNEPHVSWHAISGRPEPRAEGDTYYDTLGTLQTDPPEIIHICFMRAVRRLLRRQLTADKQNIPEFRRSLRLTGVAFQVLQNPSTRADYDLRQKGLRQPASGQKLTVPEEANGPASVGKVKVSLAELILLTRMFGEDDVLTVVSASRLLPEEGFWQYLSGSFSENPLALESLQLGYQLLRHGLISVVQFEHAYYAALHNEQHLTQVLTAAGWVNAEALDRLLTGRPVEAEVEAPKIVEIAVDQKDERGSLQVKMGAAAVPDWADQFDWSEESSQDTSAAMPEEVSGAAERPADLQSRAAAADGLLVEMPEGWTDLLPEDLQVAHIETTFEAPEEDFKAVFEGSVLEREDVPTPEPVAGAVELEPVSLCPETNASLEVEGRSLRQPEPLVADEEDAFLQPLPELAELPIESVLPTGSQEEPQSLNEVRSQEQTTNALPEVSESALDAIIQRTSEEATGIPGCEATIEDILGAEFGQEHLSLLLASEEFSRRDEGAIEPEEIATDIGEEDEAVTESGAATADERLGPGFYTLLQSMKEKGVDLGPGFRQLMKEVEEEEEEQQ